MADGVSRRQFGRLMLGGMAAYPALAETAAEGLPQVDVGLHSYSLRNIPHGSAVETIIGTMRGLGLKHLELWEPHLAPAEATVLAQSTSGMSAEQIQARKQAATEALMRWRREVKPEFFAETGRRFRAAGINLRGYNANLGETREEMDRLFVLARALGVEALCGRVPPPVTPVVASLADKHRMMFGLQSVDPHAMPQQIAQSRYFRIDLDIGDFAKAGHDALAFVRQNYGKIADIHLKDCVLNGPSVPFGTGDSHLAEVLQFVAENRPQIQTYIDCDYPGTGQSIDEIRRCRDFARTALQPVRAPV